MNKTLKRVLKATAWGLGTGVAGLALVFVCAWKSPKYYQLAAGAHRPVGIVPFSDYPAIANHPRPYVLRAPGYVVFGASHTRDPAAPEIRAMAQDWQRLRPTVALVEGRLGFLLPPFQDPVATLGEGGQVKALAQRDGVPLYNWDLPKEALARQLGTRFAPEQVALAQILSPYFSNLRFGRPASPDDYVAGYLSRAAYVGLEGRIRSVADVDQLWKKYFPAGPDWRDTSDEHALPGFLAPLMAAGNDLRNEHLASVIRELQSRGERVFVCCGSSHAACLAPALGAAAP